MSVTSETLAPPVVSAPTKEISRALLIGVAASSCGALLLELALTRLFSVVLFYHFAFLAISIALLGLGSGGVFAYLGKQWLARFETRTLLVVLCAANALAVPAVLELCLHVGVSLELSRSNFARLTAIYLVSAVPFFLTGVGFSVLFARETDHIPRLYGADLAGGALACLLVVPLLNWLGGPNAVLFAGALAAAAGAVWAASPGARKLTTALMIALLLLIAANRSGKLIDITKAKGKLRDPAWVEFARWNAISRVEVDRQGDAKAIVIDADASTYIMNADPRQWKGTEWEADLMSAPPALANVLRPRGEYAIIGPGGGVDVLRAVANGSPSVIGIEINSIIANTIMRGRYADYAFHLYERPEVHIHVGDGRSFIRNSKQSFDVVQMTLVDTWASTGAGAFALSENSLYTVEAFREYFEHLKPDGLVAITRWEFHQPREALRVVAVAMQALHELGVRDPARNFMVVSQGQLDEDGIPVVVLAKKSAFTAKEEEAVRAHMRAYGGLVPIFLPSNLELPPKFEKTPFSALITGNDPYAFAQQYAYNVAPVRDNAPFFFFTLKLGQILGRRQGLEQGIDWKVNVGVAVLATVLVISVAAVLAFLIAPLALQGQRKHPSVVPLFYFVAIGLGYILVEIAFIQRFVLFLGHPTYALTVVVFLLLLASGAGSLASRRWLGKTGRSLLPLAVIACVILLYVFVLPGILNALVGLPFVAKLAVSTALLAPLGFAMGMPFPSGLRALAATQRGEAKDNAVEWAWAVNAGSSVLGSVLAMVIAIQFGLNVTLACGAVAYLAALWFSRTLAPASRRV
ncbi:MAG: spermidine synthase [Terriglobales bacterium]